MSMVRSPADTRSLSSGGTATEPGWPQYGHLSGALSFFAPAMDSNENGGYRADIGTALFRRHPMWTRSAAETERNSPEMAAHGLLFEMVEHAWNTHVVRR